MEDGDRYVVYSENTLYNLPNSSCSEGDSVNLRGQTVNRLRFINGKLYKSDSTTISNYSDTYYTCHVYSSYTDFRNSEVYILPATLFVLCLFACIYHWFLRLRG